MHSPKLLKTVLVAVVVTLSPAAQAVVTFDFEGAVNFSRLGFTRGQVVSGTLSYDETLSDRSPGAGFAVYGPVAVTDLAFTVDGTAPALIDLGGSMIEVNVGGASDVVEIGEVAVAFAGLSDCSVASTCGFSLEFRDPPPNTVLAGNTPPDAVPTLAQLLQFPIVQGNFVGLDSALGRVTSVQFAITSLTQRTAAVSEPGTLALSLVAGLTLVRCSRTARRRPS